MEDSIYRLRHRDLLAICVLALLGLGVIMVESAASGLTGEVGWQWSKIGTRDVIYACIAVAAFVITGHIDYRILYRSYIRPARASVTISTNDSLESAPQILRSFTPTTLRQMLANPVIWIYIAGVICCAVVLVPGIGKEVNGARRWLNLGPIQLQASEAGKWACVLLFAWLLSARPLDFRRYWHFLLALVPLGVIGLLVVKEDFGTAALIGLGTLALLYAGRIKLWHLLTILPPLAAGACFFVISEPYRVKRILAFRNPFENPQQEGYHLVQSLLSYASGGIAGKGLGNGIQKLGYLPEDTTDFIFAIICEELGLFGAMLTVILYLGLAWACWNIVRQTKDPFGQLLAFGVGAMISMQAMLNIAVATVSVPPKGLPLPLVSYGGTGLVITSAMLGLVYSVSRISERQGAREAGQLPLGRMSQAL